jgi:DNA-binding MarR family transcriptional regulator
VLNREKSKTLGMETVIDLIFREVRELGIGIVYLDQHPSLISYPALGNTSTHIYMNLGLDTKYSSDILDASNMLGLKGEEGDYLRRLPTGHAFMLMRKLSFPNPFLVEFPLVEIQKGVVTDDLVKEVMQGKLIEQIKIAKEVKIVENAIADKEVKTISMEELDDSHWKMIEILGNFRASATSGIYSLIAMSGSAFKKRADMLKDAGLIGSSIGNVYRQRAIYYFLTDEGEKQFNSKFQRKIDALEFDANKMKDFLMNYFTLKGFMVMENKPEQINFSRGIMKISVNLETEINEEKLKEKLKHCTEEESYFACANEQIKNFVIQQAAKCCSIHSLNRLPVLVGSINELNEGKDFKKIEFQSS